MVIGGGSVWGFIVYLIFGLYFINYAFSFINLPEFFDNIDKWITLVAGILLIVGGINYSRAIKSPF